MTKHILLLFSLAWAPYATGMHWLIDASYFLVSIYPRGSTSELQNQDKCSVQDSSAQASINSLLDFQDDAQQVKYVTHLIIYERYDEAQKIIESPQMIVRPGIRGVGALFGAAGASRSLPLMRSLLSHMDVDTNLVSIALSSVISDGYLPLLRLVIFEFLVCCMLKRDHHTIDSFKRFIQQEMANARTDEVRDFLKHFCKCVDTLGAEQFHAQLLKNMRLHSAIKRRDAPAAYKLIAQGVFGNDEYGKNALEKTREYRCARIAANIEIFQQFGKRLFELLKIAPEKVSGLIAKYPVFTREQYVDEEGNTLLHAAIRQGNGDLVKLILARNPQLISIKNKSCIIKKGRQKDGLTPLEVIVLNDQWPLFIELFVALNTKVAEKEKPALESQLKSRIPVAIS